MTVAERISLRARLEDIRTDLERLRDDAPLGTALANTLARMVDDANAAIRGTGG